MDPEQKPHLTHREEETQTFTRITPSGFLGFSQERPEKGAQTHFPSGREVMPGTRRNAPEAFLARSASPGQSGCAESTPAPLNPIGSGGFPPCSDVRIRGFFCFCVPPYREKVHNSLRFFISMSLKQLKITLFEKCTKKCTNPRPSVLKCGLLLSEYVHQLY